EKGFSYLKKMKEWGATTVEIKSGYGLTFKDELKILRVIKKLSDQRIITVVPTFLGAHTCPIEYKGKPDDYIKLICNEMIPAVAKENLAVFCDVFIEIGGFSVRQAEKICEAAQKNALKIRLHVNQFSSLGGIELAKSLKVFSLDHLEGLEEKEIEALKHLDVTATLLPGVSFFLGSPYAQARKLIDNSIRIALASDFNPGSCMSYNLALMATIGITQMKMTFSEALAGITLNGAYSLDLQNTTGSLAGGKRADLIILNSNDFRLPFYHFGENHISKTFSYLDFL
ncbi:MAG: imidazolonepropionase, partial [Deltaproteobacteria bacterium]|nr:imidazolonepropionase [Deltaproteobacteria bacterium]